MKTNWTQQLRDSQIGVSLTFPSYHYASILTCRKRLTQGKEGTWQTIKQAGAESFTVIRTS